MTDDTEREQRLQRILAIGKNQTPSEPGDDLRERLEQLEQIVALERRRRRQGQDPMNDEQQRRRERLDRYAMGKQRQPDTDFKALQERLERTGTGRSTGTAPAADRHVTTERNEDES